MNNLTKVFLVLLRLAIGWHFMVEGYEKLHSVQVGVTTTNKPFSSAAFLRESPGPLAKYIRQQVGDVDQFALDRLTLRPAAGDAANAKLVDLMPAALDQEWNDYFKRFGDYYQLAPEQRQRAEDLQKKAKEQTVKWLMGGSKVMASAFPQVGDPIEMMTPMRLDLYRKKLAEVRSLEGGEGPALPVFSEADKKKALGSARADAAKMRSELLADLDQQTMDMQKSLWAVLTPQQQEKGDVPAPVTKEELASDPTHNPEIIVHNEQRDRAVMWLLLVAGGCLLVGLLTRLACLAGAAFLLLLYLAYPPWPGLPQPPGPSHFVFVNYQLIELLALLTLATTRSGRWWGLDGLVQFLYPWRWRARKQPVVVEGRRPGVAAPV